MPVDDVTWTLDNIVASEGWSDNDPERTLEAVHHLYRNAGLPAWQMCVALKQAADATRRRQTMVGSLARPIAYFMVALETTVHLQASLPAAELVPAPSPADPVARDLWELVQRSLQDVLPERVHTAYFRDAVGVRFDRAARVLDVQAGPGARARRLERWLTDVQHCATRAAGGELRVRFLDVDQSSRPAVAPAPANPPAEPQRRRVG
jgi:hypothetical protein